MSDPCSVLSDECYLLRCSSAQASFCKLLRCALAAGDAYFCIHICICYEFVSSMKLFLLLVDVLI